jgi:hypothetical protein
MLERRAAPLRIDDAEADAEALFATVVEAWRLAATVRVRVAGARLVAIDGVPAAEAVLPAKPPVSTFVDMDTVGYVATADSGVYPNGGRGVEVVFRQRAALYTLSADAPAFTAQVVELAASWRHGRPLPIADAAGTQIVVVGRVPRN